MSNELKAIADNADVIINGYAFRQVEQNISVLNLNRPEKASVLTPTGAVLETSMDDIELEIVKTYLARSLKYMEA